MAGTSYATQDLRVAYRYGRAIVSRRPPIIYAEVTMRCDARCAYCPYWRLRPAGELDDWRPVARHFLPAVMVLTGGEPLTRADLERIVSDLKTEGVPFVSLLTNGHRLTLERAADLRLAGLDGVSVSLNHLGAAHDRQRGIPGLYAHLERVVPRLPAFGFRRVACNVVITAANLAEIPAIADQVRRWGAELSVSCYSPRKTGDTGPLIPRQRHGELQHVVERLLSLKDEWPGLVSSRWYLERVPDFFRTGRISDCPAGRAFLHITPQGLVKPCPDLDPVAPFREYDPSKAPTVACDCCWYACRGESQAPMTLARVVEMAQCGRGARLVPDGASEAGGKHDDSRPCGIPAAAAEATRRDSALPPRKAWPAAER